MKMIDKALKIQTKNAKLARNPQNLKNTKNIKNPQDSQNLKSQNLKNIKNAQNPRDFKDSNKNTANINVLKSSFISSAADISQAPSVLYTEVAVLGRSNVGKSSLINLLLNNKNLAKSSSTPGKTRLINFFLSSWRKDFIDSMDSAESTDSIDSIESKIADSANLAQNSVIYDIRFIDFPGFGYAKVSKSEKQAWDRNLSDFLKKRESIKLFIHLVDSRHTNLEIDKNIFDFLSCLKRADSEILQVFTKGDKLNKNELVKLKNKIVVSNTDKNSVESLRCAILRILFGV